MVRRTIWVTHIYFFLFSFFFWLFHHPYLSIDKPTPKQWLHILYPTPTHSFQNKTTVSHRWIYPCGSGHRFRWPEHHIVPVPFFPSPLKTLPFPLTQIEILTTPNLLPQPAPHHKMNSNKVTMVPTTTKNNETALKIVSLNVKGLNTPEKHCKLLLTMHRLNASIIFYRKPISDLITPRN